MSSIAKCGHCGQEVGETVPDSSGRALCPFCGQPLPVNLADWAATAPSDQTPFPSPAPATPAVPVAVARVGGSPPNGGGATRMARVAPADVGAAPVVARALVPPAAPVVARVVAPVAAAPVVPAPVVARVAGPVVPPTSLASKEPADPAPAIPASGEASVGQDDFRHLRRPPSSRRPALRGRTIRHQSRRRPTSISVPWTS